MVEKSDTLLVLLSVKHLVLVKQCARCSFTCGACKEMFKAKFRDVQLYMLAESLAEFNRPLRSGPKRHLGHHLAQRKGDICSHQASI